MDDSSDTANEDEIDATDYKRRQEFLELRAHFLRVFASTWRAASPACLRSKVKRMNFANFSRRCAGVSFRFSRNKLRSTSPICSRTRSTPDPTFFLAIATENTTLAW